MDVSQQELAITMLNCRLRRGIHKGMQQRIINAGSRISIYSKVRKQNYNPSATTRGHTLMDQVH